MVCIGAAAKLNGMSYNQFIHGLKVAGVELDRKILADLAVRDPGGFKSLAEQAKGAIGGGGSETITLFFTKIPGKAGFFSPRHGLPLFLAVNLMEAEDMGLVGA